MYPNGSGASQGTHLSVFLEVSLEFFLKTNLNYLMNNQINLILNMSSGGQLVVCMQNLPCSASFECMVGVSVEI